MQRCVGWLAIVVMGCGSGDSQHTDAAVDAQPDAAPDAALPIGITAIAAANITAFTLTKSQDTKVPYASIAYDDQSEYETATSTFKAKFAGDYLVCASLMIDVLTVDLHLYAYKNGVREIGVATGNGVATGCQTVRLAAGDKLDIRAAQGQLADRAAAPDATWQWLTISRVSSTVGALPTDLFSIAKNTLTKVPFGLLRYDDDAELNAVANSFVPAHAGDYQFCAGIDWGANFQGDLHVSVNGTDTAGIAGATPEWTNGCRTLRLAASDVVAVQGYQNVVTQAQCPLDDQWTRLTVQKQPLTVSATGISGLSLTADTYSKVTYNSEQIDDMAQLATGTFTAGTAGDYLVCASLLTGSTAANPDELVLHRGGAREKGLRYGNNVLDGCRVLRLAAGEQIEVFVYSRTTASLTSNAIWDALTISKLR